MSPSRRWAILAAGGAALGALSVVVPSLALFVAVALLVAFLSLPVLAPAERTFTRLAFAVAALLAGVGVLRFVIAVAVPSLVGAGNNAQAFGAVSRMREIRFAELALQKQALIDPDHDGRGSAAFLGELSGALPLRGGARLEPPLLSDTYRHSESTPVGPATLVSGYYYLVCLPKAGGGLTAEPRDGVDESEAARRFLVYAWPAAEKHGPERAFVVDESDKILVLESLEDGGNRYAGPNFPPPCHAALAEATRDGWRPWRGKSL